MNAIASLSATSHALLGCKDLAPAHRAMANRHHMFEAQIYQAAAEDLSVSRHWQAAHISFVRAAAEYRNANMAEKAAEMEAAQHALEKAGLAFRALCC